MLKKNFNIGFSSSKAKFPVISAIFDEFSELCTTFGTIYLEKSSNTAKILEKMKKKSFNYSITYYLNGYFWNQKCS